MDPDMVRQQAEAEREALALLKGKPAGSVPTQTAPVAKRATVSAPEIEHLEIESAGSPAVNLAITAASSPKAPAAPAALSTEKREPALHYQPRQRREEHSSAAQLGRFISFGVAGAMLGGGLGIAAAGYLQLPADLAQLAIFGPAALFAAICAIASFFAKAPQQSEARQGELAERGVR